MNHLILQIIAGILGIWLAIIFVSGVSLEIIPGQSSLFNIEFTATWQILILIGICFGSVNFFIKPVLKFITTPIRILTLGFATLFINMFLVWIIDVFFLELSIEGITALFWATIIIWLLNFLLLRFYSKKI